MKKIKIAAVFAVLFAVCLLHAQKPLMVAVWAEPNVNDKENRVASLIWEYYKSELATHSGLQVLAADAFSAAREKTIPRTVVKPDQKQIKDFCAQANADIFCSVALQTLKDRKMQITVKVYDRNGKLITTVARTFNAIKESDFISVSVARDTAVAIRGDSAVDIVNLEREKRLLQELKDKEEEDRQKQKNENQRLRAAPQKSKAGLE